MKTYKLFTEMAGDSFASMSDSDFERWKKGNPGAAAKADQVRKKAQSRERLKQAKAPDPSQEKQDKRQSGALVKSNSNYQRRDKKTQERAPKTAGVGPKSRPGRGSGSAGNPRTSGRYRKGEEGWRQVGRKVVGDKYGDVFGKSKMKRKEAMGNFAIDKAKEAGKYAWTSAKDQWNKAQQHKVGISKSSPVA